MTSPRDPRHRRRPAPALHAAALRLEAAADDMRIDTRRGGPDIAAQLGTVHPPMTAAEFAAALGPLPDEEQEVQGPTDDCVGCLLPQDDLHRGDCPLAESPAPPPVEPLPPAPPAAVSPAAAPRAFISERSLDWSSRHDPRSREFGVRGVLAGSAPLDDRLMPTGPVLDQGAEGQCVGFAVAAAANVLTRVDPMAVRFGEPLDAEDAGQLYHRAQQLDAEPGEAYTGTSVLAGMRAAVDAGLFGGFLWAFGTRDIAQAVLQRGPVVVGIPWTTGLAGTGGDGVMAPTGDPAGGHCLAVVGLRLKGPQGQPGPWFVLQNSYGPGWGERGFGYLHHRDLAGLLRGVGEAAIPTVEAQR